MTAQPPQLAQERIDQMIAYATSYSQEKRKPTFLQVLSSYKARFALGTAGSALVAASIIFFVSSEPPQTHKVKVARTMPSEMSDIMLYDLLEDLS